MATRPGIQKISRHGNLIITSRLNLAIDQWIRKSINQPKKCGKSKFIYLSQVLKRRCCCWNFCWSSVDIWLRDRYSPAKSPLGKIHWSRGLYFSPPLNFNEFMIYTPKRTVGLTNFWVCILMKHCLFNTMLTSYATNYPDHYFATTEQKIS